VCKKKPPAVFGKDVEQHIFPQRFDLVTDGMIDFLLSARPLNGLRGTAQRQQQVAAVAVFILHRVSCRYFWGSGHNSFLLTSFPGGSFEFNFSYYNHDFPASPLLKMAGSTQKI
jgi:hypothetical protein